MREEDLRVSFTLRRQDEPMFVAITSAILGSGLMTYRATFVMQQGRWPTPQEEQGLVDRTLLDWKRMLQAVAALVYRGEFRGGPPPAS
jgi:hypothetical protein